MIDQVDERLSAWVRRITNREPDFELPPEKDDSSGVHLYLLEIMDDPERPPAASRRGLRPSLRYLVTASGKARDAHSLLSLLLDEALMAPDFEVEFEPASSQLWTALKIAPRPSFVLRVALTLEAAGRPLQRVTAPHATPRAIPMTTLYGQVLASPGMHPLPQARVEVLKMNRSTYTNSKGVFALTAIPAAASNSTWMLQVEARGLVQFVEITDTGTSENPVSVEFNLNLVDLFGLVLSLPDEKPAAQVRVELKNTGLATYTDAKGRFAIAGVPSAPTQKTLLLWARGQAQEFPIQETGTSSQPVALRMEI